MRRELEKDNTLTFPTIQREKYGMLDIPYVLGEHNIIEGYTKFHR